MDGLHQLTSFKLDSVNGAEWLGISYVILWHRFGLYFCSSSMIRGRNVCFYANKKKSVKWSGKAAEQAEDKIDARKKEITNFGCLFIPHNPRSFDDPRWQPPESVHCSNSQKRFHLFGDWFQHCNIRRVKFHFIFSTRFFFCSFSRALLRRRRADKIEIKRCGKSWA